MTIEELKKSATEEQDSVATNKESTAQPELNITNQPVRDFGNGMKEFSPEANGFKPAEVDVPVSPKEYALQMLDEVVIPKKIAEVQAANDAIEAAGGELTEEELREALGQEYVTQQLRDGAGDINDSGENIQKPKNDTITETDSVDKEIEELERDLEMDTTPTMEMPKQEYIEPITTSPERVYRKDDENKKENTVANEVQDADTKDELSEEDKDLKALDGDDEFSDPNDFEEKLKKAISDAMAPVNKKLGIEGFVISKKPVKA